MSRSLTLLLIVLALVAGANAFGADYDLNVRGLHDTAHLGGGVLVQATAFGLWKSVIANGRNDDGSKRGRKDVWVAHVFGLLTTAIVAFSWEFKDGRPSGRDFGMSMLGAGAFTAGAVLLDF